MGSSPTSATSLSPIGFRVRPGGQAVKTPPFHGGNTSSILVRVTKIPNAEAFGIFLFRAMLFPDYISRRYGGIGRRAGLRNRWVTMQVRPLLPAPYSDGDVVTSKSSELQGFLFLHVTFIYYIQTFL